MDKGIGYGNLIEELIERQYQEERLDEAPESWRELVPKNSVIKTTVEKRNGLHVVYLNHIDLQDPARFTRTPVRACRDEHTAAIIASYKCRLCACDQCIPLTVDMDDFNFSDN